MGIYLEAAKRLLERNERLSFLQAWNPEDEFRDLLMLRKDGKVITRQADTKEWRELAGGD